MVKLSSHHNSIFNEHLGSRLSRVRLSLVRRSSVCSVCTRLRLLCMPLLQEWYGPEKRGFRVPEAQSSPSPRVPESCIKRTDSTNAFRSAYQPPRSKAQKSEPPIDRSSSVESAAVSPRIKQIPRKTSSSFASTYRARLVAEKSNSPIERHTVVGEGCSPRERTRGRGGGEATRRKSVRWDRRGGRGRGTRRSCGEDAGAERGRGDNCRRAPSRCSCKEVLRRDKAPAITIEPRGNSCLRVSTHTHAMAGPRSDTLDARTRRRI